MTSDNKDIMFCPFYSLLRVGNNSKGHCRFAIFSIVTFYLPMTGLKRERDVKSSKMSSTNEKP